MLYSDSRRVHYEQSPLAEVICQIRFANIPALEKNVPAEFHEAVQAAFPRFSVKQEQQPPKLVGAGTPDAHLETPAPVSNYYLVSEDGKWKLNLSRGFIALSTVAYTSWEDFTEHFSKPLAEFIRIYAPEQFERIGLRYKNLFSRSTLGLKNEPWRNLISPAYLGVLTQEDVEEENLRTNRLEIELVLDSTCRARINAGPGKLKSNDPNVKVDDELRYIFDMDLVMNGSIDPRMAAAGMETLHAHATSLFQGALTERLHTAMQPR